MDVKWFTGFVHEQEQELRTACPQGSQPPSLVKHSLPGQVGCLWHHEHLVILAQILVQGGLELEEEQGSDEEEVQVTKDMLQQVVELQEAEQEEVLEMIMPSD